jgi:hypothetical protein
MRDRRHLSLPCFLMLLLAAASAAQTNQTVFGLEDSDGDGLEDELEFQLGSDPTHPDTDADGWGDLIELVNGTDPCDANDYPQATESGGTIAQSTLSTQRREATRQSAGVTVPGRRPPGAMAPSYHGLRYYHLPGFNPDLAAEIVRSPLAAGDYLLLWDHQTIKNPLRLRQNYVITIRRGDGKTIGEWQTPAEVETQWRTAGVPFTISPEDQLHPLTITLVPIGGAGLQYILRNLFVVPAGIEADLDRDGMIVAGERPPSGRSLRHWVNDDDDTGDWQEKADLPGLTGHRPDHAQPGIDGARDLVDFIPINLAIGEVVGRLPPSAGYRYLLCNDDQAIQVVPTSLTKATVGAVHRNDSLAVFGPTLDGPSATAEVLRPEADGGVELPAGFLDYMMFKKHGIVLVEASRPTSRPLRLEIRQDQQVVARLELPLTVVPVEEMYRHVDLTRLARTYSGSPVTPKSRPRRQLITEPPGLPDVETSTSWVVMIHGYNVSAQSARGWHAETFKRLRALGSNARFVGVTWGGDTGFDYHEAVFQAFQAGDGLPRALGFVDESRTTLVAHSLGNIVACQGVQAGFTPAHYFLLNAALPIEAIAGEAATQPHAADMTEASWRAYPRRLFAAEWGKLYVKNSQRHGYAWSNCFSRIRHLRDAVNCFSAGEDVTNCPPAMTSASVLETLWARRSVDYGVWKTQELLKGVGWTRSLGAAVMGRSQGGWGFNAAWRGRFIPSGPDRMLGGRYELLSPDIAARITDNQLLIHPFFRPFEQRWLHMPPVGISSPLMDAPRVRYDLLARGLPALSPAAGATPIPGLSGVGLVTNYDLEIQGRPVGGSWPIEGHGSPLTQERWLHSDFKNVALPCVYPLFVNMINRGGLR